YGKTIDELVEYRKSLDSSEAKIVADEEGRDALEADIRAAFADVAKLGSKLGKERAKVAKSFVGRVQKELAELSMPDAKLDAELTPRPLGDDPLTGDVPANGLESLEILLAANPGEASAPLRKVASGGELSRTMLALKSVLTGHVQCGTT